MDIIKAAENGFTCRRHGVLPNQIMFAFHPQPWTDNSFPWIKELLFQNTKNVIKYFLNKRRSSR